MTNLLAGLLLGGALAALYYEQRRLKDDMAATREELDAALADVQTEITAAAGRVEAALAALQAKVDAGGDFSAELQTARDEAAALRNIQAAPAEPATSDTGGGTPTP